MNIHIMPNVKPIKEQPVEHIEVVCDIYFRTVFLEEAGTLIPQHAHSHDHATFVGSGKVRLWVNEVWKGDFVAGKAIEVKANESHVFMSLEPNTRLTCVHDLNSASLIKEK